MGSRARLRTLAASLAMVAGASACTGSSAPKASPPEIRTAVTSVAEVPLGVRTVYQLATWDGYAAFSSLVEGAPAEAAGVEPADAIHLYDPAVKAVRTVVERTAPDLALADFAGDARVLVYVERDLFGKGPWALRVLDLATGKTRELARGSFEQSGFPPIPAVSWPWVAWVEAARRSAPSEAPEGVVRVADLRGGAIVERARGAFRDVALSGDAVVVVHGAPMSRSELRVYDPGATTPRVLHRGSIEQLKAGSGWAAWAEVADLQAGDVRRMVAPLDGSARPRRFTGPSPFLYPGRGFVATYGRGPEGHADLAVWSLDDEEPVRATLARDRGAHPLAVHDDTVAWLDVTDPNGFGLQTTLHLTRVLPPIALPTTGG